METRYSLLDRALQQEDEKAWEELHEQYKRFIFYILRESGVAPQNLEDLSQEVFLLLTQKLRLYSHEKGKFRSWLKTLIINAARTDFRKAQAYGRKKGVYLDELTVHGNTKTSDIEDYIEEEWEKFIVTEAMERIRKSYNTGTYRVFELWAAGRSAAEIANETEYKVSTVYTLIKQVKARLKQERKGLLMDLEGIE